jgi:hypothetical protein
MGQGVFVLWSHYPVGRRTDDSGEEKILLLSRIELWSIVADHFSRWVRCMKYYHFLQVIALLKFKTLTNSGDGIVPT